MVETVTKTIRLYAKQRDFLASTALFRGFAAGIASGKSWVGAYDMVRRAKANRLYMVCAPTYTLMADASFRSLEHIAGIGTPESPGLDIISDIARGSMPYIKLKTGAEILFRSTHEPDMLRGPNLSGIWMDEASLMKPDAFDILIGRLREGGELGWLSATFTPKGKANWCYKRFGTGLPDTELFHARTDDNPFLAPGFYETRKKQYTHKQSEQELAGAFLDDGGNHFNPGSWPRYSNYSQNAYSVILAGRTRQHYLKDDCTVIVGFDLALNKVNRKKLKDLTEDKTDFCAFVAAALTPDGNLLILDCINERMRLEAKAPMLASFCRRWRPHMVVTDDDMIAESMQLEFRRQRDIPEIQCLHIGNKNKVERATAAIVRGENGLIYLPEKGLSGKESEAWIEPFTDALSSFTGVDDEHDDIPDALGIIGREADELKGTGREDPLPDLLIPARDLFGF